MQNANAQKIYERLSVALAPACDRIAVAGSVRRGKPEVKDLEIVYISKIDVIAVDTLFAVETALVEVSIDQLVQAGTLAWDQQVKRHGPKYKRLVHVASGLVVELFAATAQNWGYILALRTGPADFNKMLVAPGWKGGVKPVAIKLEDGTVYRNGLPLNLPEEDDFFRALEIPYLEPHRRSAEALHAIANGARQ